MTLLAACRTVSPVMAWARVTLFLHATSLALHSRVAARVACTLRSAMRVRALPSAARRGRSSGVCVIGLCGPSASGKTTLGTALVQRFSVHLISADAFYLPRERCPRFSLTKLPFRQGVPSALLARGTADLNHPDAIDWNALCEATRRAMHAAPPQTLRDAWSDCGEAGTASETSSQGTSGETSGETSGRTSGGSSGGISVGPLSGTASRRGVGAISPAFGAKRAVSREIIVVEGLLLLADHPGAAAFRRLVDSWVVLQPAEERLADLARRKWMRRHWGNKSYLERGVTEEQYRVYWDHYVWPRWVEHGLQHIPSQALQVDCFDEVSSQVDELENSGLFT